MVARLTLLALAAAAIAACGGAGPAPADLVARALEAVGGEAAVARVERLGIRYRGVVTTEAAPGTETRLTGEILLDRPDGLATRVSVGGLVTRRALRGETGWIRQGAATADLPPHFAAERDDLLALLVAPLATGDFGLDPGDYANSLRVTTAVGDRRFLIWFDPRTALPAKIRRTVGDEVVERVFSDWRLHGFLWFPNRIVTTAGGLREEIELELVELNPVVPEGVFDRPADGGAGVLGEIRREARPARTVVMLSQKGPLVEIASADLFLDRALAEAGLPAAGPRERIFHDLEGGPDRTVTTRIPIAFDRDAVSLPRPAVVARIEETPVLVASYTGPYPRERSVYEPLVTRAAELDLEPAGDPYHVILGNPEEGAPNELSQEIVLPVKERE